MVRDKLDITEEKMILKNFIHTLKSHKTASLLNIVGLTVAFAAFYVLASQIWYSVTFNRSIPESDRIYLVSPDWAAGLDGPSQWSESCPQPATREAMAASPDAELYTWFRSCAYPGGIWNKNESGDFERFDIGCHVIGPDAIEMFGFKTTDGDLDRITEPNTVIISKSAAQRLGCRAGDPLWMNGGHYYDDINTKQMVTVAGVFEDFPQNTFLRDHHIFYNDNCYLGQENNNWNYSAIVRLKEGADPQEFARIWEKQYSSWYMGMVKEWQEMDEEDFYEEGDERLPVRLIPLDEMYFHGNLNDSYYEAGSLKTTLTLAAIALLIIIVAFINFFNFYMALVPSRIRSVNINKVLGASQKRLRIRLISEAMILAALSFALATLLIAYLSDSFITEYVTCSLKISDNIGVLAVMGAIMLIIAAFSALYPAVYSTKANTSMAVKAGFAQSKAGRTFRSVLVGMQFTVSMILLLITGVFFMQYRHMIRYDVGFDKENILTFTSRELINHSDNLIGRLQQHPDAMDVTASNNNIFSDGMSIWGRESDGKPVHIYSYAVRYNFLEFMGIPVLEGEGFSGNPDAGFQIVFTQSSAPEVAGLIKGGKFEDYTVQGTIKDIRLRPVNKGNPLIALYTHPNYGLSTFYIKIRPGTDIDAMKKYIGDLVTELEPSLAVPEITLLDKLAEKRYGDTRKETTIMGLFSVLAIMLSLMGVFSIVMFETRHRESEISIRKVYGASVREVIWMFNRRYAIIVGICFCIAAPVAWTITSRWLEQFAERIPIPLWVFPAALAAVLAITISLVTLRSLRAANSDPAETLKKE